LEESLIRKSRAGFWIRRVRTGTRTETRIATVGKGTFRNLVVSHAATTDTLKDNEVDEEAGEFRHFLRNPVCDLSGILGQCPNIRNRTKDQVNDKVDKQIKKVPL